MKLALNACDISVYKANLILLDTCRSGEDQNQTMSDQTGVQG